MILSTVVAIALLVAFLVERRLMSRRFAPYFAVGLALFPELVPIPRVPVTEVGRTFSVRWDRLDGVVRFWTDPSDRAAPMGLHGLVNFEPTSRGVRLLVRWAPPWTPILAGMWFGVLGLWRGEGLLTVPVGALFVALILHGYRLAALKAAAELRWAFIGGEGED